MKLPGEDESVGTGLPVVYMMAGAFAFVLILLFAVLKSNNTKNSGSAYLKEMQQQKEAEALETGTEQSVEPERKLRAEDLEFWDMYPVEETETDTDVYGASYRQDTAKAEKPTYAQKAEQLEREEQERKAQSEAQAEEQAKNDPSTDGKHTLVVNRDGTEEWVMLNPYLTKHTYDFTNLEEKAGLKRYLENGRKISYVGIDVSGKSGDVNFASAKAAGLDYVMIRIGGRGYSTGAITLDENFQKNIEGAVAAGLDVGVYFYSQAVSQEEAIEEVNFVIQNLEPYRANIKYPIAFDMEFAANDKARIDELSKDDKTNIATSFLEGVKAAGYVPMLYGDKEWLLKEVELARLESYDVWLAQEEELPDYPYQFTMWRYSTEGVLNGVTGDASLNICFVGYSQR